MLKKLKRVALHQVLEKLSHYLEGKKDKSELTKKEMLLPSFPALPTITKTDDEDPQDSIMKDEDDGYCSEQTADLTSDDSDLEERTQLDICQFSRNYIKVYRRSDCEEIDNPKGLRASLYRTNYRYAVYETMER